jgi:hypothetical protein
MPPDIRRPLKKFLPHLLKARDDALNEADTVQRLILFFTQILGYDQLSDIGREAQIKDRFVDIVLKIDGKTRLLVEAKAAGNILRDRHLDQVERYAAEGNHQWGLLTNGIVWKLYHLTFDEGIEYQRAFEVDLSAEDGASRGAEVLALIHRSSIAKGELDDYWRHRQALDPESIAKALFTEDALRLIRRHLRRREDVLIDIEDLAAAITELFSTEAREQIGPIKIHRKRRPSKATPEPQGSQSSPLLQPSSPQPPPPLTA